MAAAAAAAAVANRATRHDQKQQQQKQQQQQLLAGLDSSPSLLLFHSNKTKKKTRGEEDEGGGCIRAKAWSGGGVEAQAEEQRGQESPYVRPRIRKDLLPHDFSDWKCTPNGSILPACAAATPGARRSANVGIPAPAAAATPRLQDTPSAFCRPRLCEGSDSSSSSFFYSAAVEDGRFQASEELLKTASSSDKLGRHSREFSAAASLRSSMEDWSGLPCSGSAAIDKTIYQNLVEMLPLMESFMEQKEGNKRPFTRHASMVYTPNPSRDAPLKKVSESPMKSKKNKQQRPGNVIKPADAAKEEAPLWDEQENILRRVERDDCVQQQQQQQQYSEAQAMIEKLNREELVELQNQIDGLKQQLWEKDSVLKTVQSYEMSEVANQVQIVELKTKMEELQKVLWEKERLTQMIQCQLTEKQQELWNVESLLDRVQQEIMRKNEAAAIMREELSELRVQVSAFQFQAKLQSAKMTSDDGDEEFWKEEDDHQLSADVHAELEMPVNLEESRSMEAARRMYLGAVIAAKEKPGVESMALAAESRKRLEAFLTQPCFGSDSLPLF